MTAVAQKRSVMTLFSGAADVYSHQVRFVVAEKGISIEIVKVDPKKLPEDLIDLNPYGSVPTLVDRDLTLYEAKVITEYLDERFPHPPLMPVDPVSRARNRLMMSRIEKDLYAHMETILTSSKSASKTIAKARKELHDNLVMLSPIFEQMPFFMSNDLTLVDCALAPLMWHLPALGIELPKQAKGINDYAARLFKRESFQESLTEEERELRA